jgi:TPR repeat protein
MTWRALSAGPLLSALLLTSSPAWSIPTSQADKLLVVDCALPGQVRKLGRQMTILTARRAVKTSAEDCEIRGGEYVAYDRANYATALNVWLPLAQQGDPQAQTFVGEIFDKGLGTQPDHAAAAYWYQKAAEQGYSRALINLGFLHEKGLGVRKDPLAAVNLYRKAAGIDGVISLDEGAGAASRDAEIRALREELERTRRQLEKVRDDKQRVEALRETLARDKESAAQTQNLSQVARLESELKQRDDEVSRQREDTARIAAEMERLRAELAKLEAARQRETRNQAALVQELEQAKQERQGLELAIAKLSQEKDEAVRAHDSAKVHRLEAELKQRDQEAMQKKAHAQRLEQEMAAYRDQIAQLEAARRQEQERAASLRQELENTKAERQKLETVIDRLSKDKQAAVESKDSGRVKALEAQLKQQEQEIVRHKEEMARIEQEMLRHREQLTKLETTRDAAGALGRVAAAAPVRKAAFAIPHVEFGEYYALVIGNQEYVKLPKLDTAVADAKAVAQILSEKYRFKVTLITNATRYQILTELNKLRAKLTEKDNFLIYYAGHGELDRANLRGHWLPVDAEPDSDANWISSIAVTDLLNAMAAKHILVVADSCYSGAMTRSSLARLEAAISDEARLNWLKALIKARSRTVLTSGGLQPVVDGGGGKHSIFAKYFIEVLIAIGEPVEALRIYREVSARVVHAAQALQVEQKPEYAPLKFAGHESGDFLFVPVD